MTFQTWVRRSRWSLVAFVIAVPLAIVGTFSVGWFRYVEVTNPHPREVAEGQTVAEQKVKFTLVDHEVIEAESDEGQELGALDGTELVIVTFDIDATKLTDDDLVSCAFDVVAPGGGGERRWGSDQLEVSLPYGDDAYTTGCVFSDHDAFTLKQVFVVPTGTADDLKLQFMTDFGSHPVLQWDL